MSEETRAERDALERRKIIGLRVYIFIFISAFIAYASVINSYFLSDDFSVVGNILEGNWPITWAEGGFFRPLFTLSFVLDSIIWRADATGYHLTSVLLHALNSSLVYTLTARLIRNQSFSERLKGGIALAAALLFLLHPSHTEAVTWISGRADLLATFFCLAALVAFVSYTQEQKLSRLLVSLLSFALALLAKESAVSLPFVLLPFAAFFTSVENRRGAALLPIKRVAPFFALLVAFVLARRFALGSLVGGYGAGQHLNFSPQWIRDRLIQATLRSVLPALPLELSNVLLKPLRSPAFILLAAVCVIFIIFLLVRRRRLVDQGVRREQNRLLLVLTLSFIASLLPVINLRLSLFDTQGERFIYWPSVFASMLVALIAAVMIRDARLWLALMIGVLLFYSVCLYRTNLLWREAAALSQSIVLELIRPDATLMMKDKLLVINAPDNLRGVPVFHNGLDDALRVFQHQRRIERTSLLALHSLGATYHGVELKREAGALTVRLLDEDDSFVRVFDAPACVEILGRSARSVSFRLNSCPADVDLFFFSEGRMYRVLDQE